MVLKVHVENCHDPKIAADLQPLPIDFGFGRGVGVMLDGVESDMKGVHPVKIHASTERSFDKDPTQVYIHIDRGVRGDTCCVLPKGGLLMINQVGRLRETLLNSDEKSAIPVIEDRKRNWFHVTITNE